MVRYCWIHHPLRLPCPGGSPHRRPSASRAAGMRSDQPRAARPAASLEKGSRVMCWCSGTGWSGNRVLAERKWEARGNCGHPFSCSQNSLPSASGPGPAFLGRSFSPIKEKLGEGILRVMGEGKSCAPTPDPKVPPFTFSLFLCCLGKPHGRRGSVPGRSLIVPLEQAGSCR